MVARRGNTFAGYNSSFCEERKMAEMELSQIEADRLISMEKHRVDNTKRIFPGRGERLSVPLTSLDKREMFMLDVTRGMVRLTKATFQNRSRQAIVLLRLDVDGSPHRNPDGAEVPCPHLHVYRAGYGDKWAFAAPNELVAEQSDLHVTLGLFMKLCNVTQPPIIEAQPSSIQGELF